MSIEKPNIEEEKEFNSSKETEASQEFQEVKKGIDDFNPNPKHLYDLREKNLWNRLNLIKDKPENPFKNIPYQIQTLSLIQLYADINKYRKNDNSVDLKEYFTAVREIFKGKKILEIGSGEGGGVILSLKKIAPSIEATMVDKGSGMYATSGNTENAEKSQIERIFKPAKIDTVYIDDYKDTGDLHNFLNKKGQFDIIISERVFYDGDRSSIQFNEGTYWDPGDEITSETKFWFGFYNSLLKRDGLGAHNLFGEKEKFINQLLSLNDVKLKYIGRCNIFDLFTKE